MIRHLCAVLALGLFTSFAAADAIVTNVIQDANNAGTASTALTFPPPLGATNTISAAGLVGISGQGQPVLFGLSRLEVFFTLATLHAYNFQGIVSAFAETGTANAGVMLAIPPTTPIEGPYLPINETIPFNESGVLAPGTYVILAGASAQGERGIRGFDGFAEAGFRYTLTLRDLGNVLPRIPPNGPPNGPPTGPPNGPPSVPEPASLALLGIGGLAIWLRRRR